jgi:hypothetical protein
MLTEPVRSASKKLFPPKAGEEFDGVREIKARTRAFLAKLVASSAVLVTLVAAGYAVVTRQYGMLSVTWSIAGPLLAGITVYHFAASAREEVEREAILWRLSELSAQPGDSASAHALAQVEVDFRHALTHERRLNPFVWLPVAILIGATSTIAVNAHWPPQSEPVLPGLLLFLSLLGLAMMVFLWFDQRVRYQDLLRNGHAGLERTRTLKLRNAELTRVIRQRRESQKG